MQKLQNPSINPAPNLGELQKIIDKYTEGVEPDEYLDLLYDNLIFRMSHPELEESGRELSDMLCFTRHNEKLIRACFALKSQAEAAPERKSLFKLKDL